MLKIKKHSLIFIILGMVYLVIELANRSFQAELVGHLEGIKVWSLAGWTSLWMMPIGGLIGVLLGILNDKTKLHMSLKCLFGALIIYSIEFTSGCICNLWLNMGIWDYSHLPLNLLGQISIVYLPVWFFITPLAMWLDDSIRYWFYKEGTPSKLVNYYLNIFRKTQKY